MKPDKDTIINILEYIAGYPGRDSEISDGEFELMKYLHDQGHIFGEHVFNTDNKKQIIRIKEIRISPKGWRNYKRLKHAANSLEKSKGDFRNC